MTIVVKIDLSGMDNAENKINNAVNTALQKLGFMIERDAKIFSPVKTGRLRASINSQSDNMKVNIRDGVVYGIYQEYGTKFMKAQPFMNPALVKNIPQIGLVIAEEIKKVMK